MGGREEQERWRQKDREMDVICSATAGRERRGGEKRRGFRWE